MTQTNLKTKRSRKVRRVLVWAFQRYQEGSLLTTVQYSIYAIIVITDSCVLGCLEHEGFGRFGSIGLFEVYKPTLPGIMYCTNSHAAMPEGATG